MKIQSSADKIAELEPIVELKEDVFQYLDELKESKIVDMFDSNPYIVKKFNDQLLEEVMEDLDEATDDYSNGQINNKIKRKSNLYLLEWIKHKINS